MKLAVTVLAAGKGTRMHSDLPKVMHPLAGRPLVEYSVDLALRLSPEPPVLVVGHGAEPVRKVVGNRARYVVQDQQLGTGHAVLQAEGLLQGKADIVLVYYSDMPLFTIKTMRHMVAVHSQHPGPVTMLTVIDDDPRGFGRIIRNADNDVMGIVEEVEATLEQKKIRELNASVYCFDAEWLWPALHRIEPSKQKGELYLTDTIALAIADDHRVAAVTLDDPSEALGINTRVHLSEAEHVLRRRINLTHMTSGVTMIDPESTYIHPGVVVGENTILGPGVCLFGNTSIGQACEIGPGAVLTDVELGDSCTVEANTVLSGITIGSEI
ncbi:MAG: NTP transferase domain-containing protein [Chloroflexi bacterium]|nr:NTP transferase domain-containing protein [Chloroflexota bacterium]